MVTPRRGAAPAPGMARRAGFAPLVQWLTWFGVGTPFVQGMRFGAVTLAPSLLGSVAIAALVSQPGDSPPFAVGRRVRCAVRTITQRRALYHTVELFGRAGVVVAVE